MDNQNRLDIYLTHRNDTGWSLVAKQLKRLSETYQVVIHYHDLVGLSFSCDDSQAITRPYLFHNNPYCNHIKADTKGLLGCIAQKNRLIQIMQQRQKPLYGTCPQGFEECVFPLLDHQTLIGLLCIGHCSSLKEADQWDALFDDIGILKTLLEHLYVDFAQRMKLDPLPDAMTPKNQHLVYTASQFIQTHYTHPLSLELVANQIPCNPTYLSTQFKKAYPLGFSGYINQVRIQHALFYLKSTHLTITEIAFICGYQDVAYFSKTFKKKIGISPNAYRHANKV